MSISLITADNRIEPDGAGAILAQIESALDLSAWAIGSKVLAAGERSRTQMTKGLAGGFSLGIFGRLAYVMEIAYRSPTDWLAFSKPLTRIDWATISEDPAALGYRMMTDKKIHRMDENGMPVFLRADGGEDREPEPERLKGGLLPDAPRHPGKPYRLFDAYSQHKRRPLLTRQAMSTLLAAVAEPLRGPRYKVLASLLGVTDKRMMRWAQGEAPSRTIMVKLLALQAIRSRGESFSGDWTRMPLP